MSRHPSSSPSPSRLEAAKRNRSAARAAITANSRTLAADDPGPPGPGNVRPARGLKPERRGRRQTAVVNRRGEKSVREVQRELAAVQEMIDELAACRRLLSTISPR